jgi:flagellar hook assembly protein FlgD
VLSPDDVTGTDTPKAPEASYLAQNYPNPFNPTTRLAFGLSATAHVSLKIYDAAGRLVRALVNEQRRAGRYEETWDGRDSGGRAVASGIYFYRLNAGVFESTKKMILVR